MSVGETARQGGGEAGAENLLLGLGDIIGDPFEAVLPGFVVVETVGRQGVVVARLAHASGIDEVLDPLFKNDRFSF
jgi:hypothetical protein